METIFASYDVFQRILIVITLLIFIFLIYIILLSYILKLIPYKELTKIL